MADPFIGQIVMFGGNFAPRGWAFCDGQLLAISSNNALFSILGTTYGGDGRTSFGLPDLRGRSPVHAGSGTGAGLTQRRLGQRGGVETTTLALNNLPSHNHTGDGQVEIRASGNPANSSDPTGNNLAMAEVYTDQATSTSMAANPASFTTSDTGGGQSFENMHPWQAVNFIIALVGTFPSRN